jgi:hypothetical protein
MNSGVLALFPFFSFLDGYLNKCIPYQDIWSKKKWSRALLNSCCHHMKMTVRVKDLLSGQLLQLLQLTDY